jgi:hypothetical protein
MKGLMIACLTMLVCTACSSGAAPPPSRLQSPHAAATLVVPSRTVTTAATPTLANLSATDIVNGLKNAGLPIGQVQTYDASNDPNHLLGRPGQYTSKVNFADTRLPAASGLDVSGGGSVEAFSSLSDAQTRAAYLATVTGALGALGGEYDYRSGTVVLRLGFELTPDQAQQYASQLAALTRQPVALATPTARTPTP